MTSILRSQSQNKKTSLHPAGPGSTQAKPLSEGLWNKPGAQPFSKPQGASKHRTIHLTQENQHRRDATTTKNLTAESTNPLPTCMSSRGSLAYHMFFPWLLESQNHLLGSWNKQASKQASKQTNKQTNRELAANSTINLFQVPEMEVTHMRCMPLMQALQKENGTPKMAWQGTT